MKVKVNKQIGVHSPGSIVNVECDKSGIPLSLFWRRRFKDAETDNCCEVVKPKVKKPAKRKDIGV